MSKIAVFGAGNWGTAFSLVLADCGHDVTIWARRPELSERINLDHVNPEYLPGVRLPMAVDATHDPEQALSGADVVVLAVPAQSLRANLEQWADAIPRGAVLMSLMKGIEHGSMQRMTEVIEDVTGIGDERVAVLSGPNLAREIAERQPAAAVIACTDDTVAKQLQRTCHSSTFRPYTHDDVVGCELGGATKNVIALAVGMAVGLGFGDNARASVITRGLVETARLGAAAGANPLTFSGLAGLGDLVATCSSPLSRNRTFGERLGRGETVADIAASTRQVAEGVASCVPIGGLAERYGVDMPIVDHVSRLLAGELTPQGMLKSLIARAAKSEFE